MPKYKFIIPGTDAGVNIKLNQFKTGFSGSFGALGYDAADLDQVIAASVDFNAALNASLLARDAATNAVKTKDTTKQSSISTARLWAQRVQNNPAATPAMLTSMGIVPASAPAGPVTVPTFLGANPSSSGTCVLTWNANGNTRATTYVLEQNIDGTGWTWLGSTTKRRFEDGGATPGVPKLYRVRAQRGGVTSAPSAEAGIYGGEGSVELKVAA